jgi:hypothetical protein
VNAILMGVSSVLIYCFFNCQMEHPL